MVLRSEKIHKKNNFLISKHNFSLWKTAVIDDSSSLHNKTLMLKDALNKLHLLRVLDDLHNYKDSAIQRKEMIAEKVQNLEFIIEFNNKMDFFGNIVKYSNRKIEVEGKISQLCLTLQNHLEI
jgi:hypothetical protein